MVAVVLEARAAADAEGSRVRREAKGLTGLLGPAARIGAPE
jgi:hypothetical protein